MRVHELDPKILGVSSIEAAGFTVRERREDSWARDHVPRLHFFQCLNAHVRTHRVSCTALVVLRINPQPCNLKQPVLLTSNPHKSAPHLYVKKKSARCINN